MRSMWRGAITFGLVMIPVKLYAATEQHDVAFRQVHRADGGRITFRRICSVCGEEVPFADVAKGYELPDGEIVVLTDDDLAELPLPTAHSIDVVNFTPASQLDPLLWGRSYYTEPEPAGLRAYALLRDALERSGRVALARVALRQRESLAALRSHGGVLVLATLLWPDEIRVPDFGFLDQEIEVRPQELTMASSLIDSMTVDFDPASYHDGYREAVEALVAAKTEGHEVAVPPPRAPEGVGSLADALRASLAAARGAGGGEDRASLAAASGGGDGGADGKRKRASRKRAPAASGSGRANPARSPGAGGERRTQDAQQERARRSPAPSEGASRRSAGDGEEETRRSRREASA